MSVSVSKYCIPKIKIAQVIKPIKTKKHPVKLSKMKLNSNSNCGKLIIFSYTQIPVSSQIINMTPPPKKHKAPKRAIKILKL